jgi:hypothetical protein
MRTLCWVALGALVGGLLAVEPAEALSFSQQMCEGRNDKLLLETGVEPPVVCEGSCVELSDQGKLWRWQFATTAPRFSPETKVSFGTVEWDLERAP